MLKRYKFRAYPTTRQGRDLARVFGCCRFVYNSVIADRQAIYESGLYAVTEPAPTASNPGHERRSFDASRQSALITYQRSKHPWLCKAPSVALIQAMRDAEQAFSNFFASVTGERQGPRVGFPKFKSRFTSTQSARFTREGFHLPKRGGRVDLCAERVFIAKIGWVRFTNSQPLPSIPSSVTGACKNFCVSPPL